MLKKNKKRKAVVFGIGNHFEKFKEKIYSLYDVVALIDNNYREKEGVVPVEAVCNLDYDEIVITTFFWEEMYQQLIDLGVDKRKIVLWEKIESINYSCGFECYGQHFDDLIIAAIFGMIGIKHPSYLDLGANSPYIGSNTAALYLSGSRGVNIDANPVLIEEIEKARPEDTNLNLGIAASEGTLTYYKFDEKSGLNTFSYDEVKRLENMGYNRIIESIDMPVIKLETVIEKYCDGSYPDLLDCDIEGLDYEVLNSCSFFDDGPKVICVEVRPYEIEKFDELLIRQGYFKFCRIGENNIYVREEYKEKLMHCKRTK